MADQVTVMAVKVFTTVTPYGNLEGSPELKVKYTQFMAALDEALDGESSQYVVLPLAPAQDDDPAYQEALFSFAQTFDTRLLTLMEPHLDTPPAGCTATIEHPESRCVYVSPTKHLVNGVPGTCPGQAVSSMRKELEANGSTIEMTFTFEYDFRVRTVETP